MRESARGAVLCVCLTASLLTSTPALAQNWSDVERTPYALDSLFTGGEFVDFPTVPVADARVELPVEVRGNVAYNADSWTAIAEFGDGYNGTSLRGGFEQRFDRIELRGGARYLQERWEPTALASISPIISVSMSPRLVRARTLKGNATWRSQCRYGSCRRHSEPASDVHSAKKSG